MKRSASRVLLLELGWSQVERAFFLKCQKGLENQVTLAQQSSHIQLNVHTSTSAKFWSGVVTQVPREDILPPHSEQRHSPLAFKSEHFSGSQLVWSTLENEAFAIMATIYRMLWLLATLEGFDLYTDHRSLIFLFDPRRVMPDLSQTSIRKVL